MRSIVVVGAGLAGLTAALRVARGEPRARVIVAERDARLGGQIWTERDADVLVERGGEGFVFRSEAVARLAADVGLGEQLIGQAVLTSYGFDARGLVALAPGEAAAFLGFQVAREDFGRGIRSLRGGMGSLIDGLARACAKAGVTVRRRAEVARVTRERGGLVAELGDGASLEASAVIVATTAARAAEVLAPVLDAASRDALAAAATVSSVTVELELDRAAVDHPLDGTGFVVATAHQEHGLRACTFTTSKFEARAPGDRALLRAFFRPARDERDLSDEAWTERAVRGIGRALPLRGAPLRSWVSRWPDALPVHSAAHGELVAAIERALQPLGVFLAGAAFHGAGIDAAVRSAERAAHGVQSARGVQSDE